MSPARRASAHFRTHKFLYGYAKRKAAWDPAYPEMAARLRGGTLPVLDVGCGIGLLAAYLRESGCAQAISGIEPDEKKVRLARKFLATTYEKFDFQVGDALTLPEFSGEVVLLDIIHYMDRPLQRGVLEEAVRRLAPGGRLFIRTTLCDGSWRYYATLLEEAFIRTIGWIRGGRCQFPTLEEIRAPFEQMGWGIAVSPMWGRTPFNSYLMEIRRPEQGGQTGSEGAPYSKKVSSCAYGGAQQQRNRREEVAVIWCQAPAGIRTASPGATSRDSPSISIVPVPSSTK